MKRITVLAICLVLAMSLAAFAQTAAKKTPAPAAPKAAAVKILTATGTIVSADPASLVITHKVAGKDAQMTFALATTTKKTGDMVKDAKVTVHYTVDGTTNKATAVTATAPKPPAAPKAAAPKKVTK